eukprot:366278-Chlamydomonas_euryale.AAC.39
MADATAPRRGRQSRVVWRSATRPGGLYRCEGPRGMPWAGARYGVEGGTPSDATSAAAAAAAAAADGGSLQKALLRVAIGFGGALGDRALTRVLPSPPAKASHRVIPPPDTPGTLHAFRCAWVTPGRSRRLCPTPSTEFAGTCPQPLVPSPLLPSAQD